MIKLKTERDVLQLTVKHLKQDIEQKAALIRSQNEELKQLRDSVLKLKAQKKQISPKKVQSPERVASHRTLGTTPNIVKDHL